jgi:hypothetical protein
MTATYTANRTWTAGEVVTAAIMNQYIRDNLDYLKARPVARVSDLDGTVSNTSSTSFVDVTGATVDITTSGTSRLLIIANFEWGLNVAASAYMAALVDGTNLGDATNGNCWSGSLPNAAQHAAFVFLTASTVANGLHTVKLQYRASANTLTVYGYSLAVLEVY